ncbi:hypothetical protein LNJ05_12260 [Tenacibaculum finnmarkense genomovar ulcerans]|uniref:hypothetical protein n=1 Tax=Tenacibaculum finnmarkense TaxID=2781243 RepID=UPI00187B82C8|nr:hypothetical protein [Tenacibaculum finnmarkense]MBE7649178.1 hypothetical protein [Tenacibaculum finnmarkense genomovar ulcerans]MCD8433535.1 hypothetical protein [Tenacibaculum finnmarkense genomovar ulcerans]
MIDKYNIDEVKKWASIVSKKIDYYSDDDFDIEIGEESIYISLPGDDQGEALETEDFINFGFEISDFKIENHGRIQTTTLTYQIIKAESEDLEYYLKNTSDFYQEIDGIELRIMEAPIYVGIACIELGAYHDDFGSNYQHLLAIEITYPDKRNRLNLAEETELIYSYLFEIADSTGLIFYLSKIIVRDPELEQKIEALINVELGVLDGEEEKEEEKESVEEISEDDYVLKPLLAYSESMKLYVSALQTNDKELRLLNFYKILEYYAPIVINIGSYQLLAQKLDSPKVLKPNRVFLKSIFDLVNSTNQRLRDSELIKSVFNTCFDLVDTFHFLPESMQRKVLGIIKEKEINYNTKKEKLSQASNIISNTLYSTRNKVVHAKSNFEPTGDECNDKDIEQLNIFLKEITGRIIRWSTKLPDIQK